MSTKGIRTSRTFIRTCVKGFISTLQKEQKFVTLLHIDLEKITYYAFFEEYKQPLQNVQKQFQIMSSKKEKKEPIQMTQNKKTLKNKMETITCNHCHKKILQPELVGLTLVCPYCKRSVNGQYYHKFVSEHEKETKKHGGGLDGRKKI